MPVTVWAISDLHLSHANPQPRERYAARWRDHAARIAEQWRAVVRPEDLVLLPGDVSMARDHRAVQPDLDWLARLPGTKVLAPGNHDRWFNRVERVRPLLRAGQLAVRADAVATHGVVVCGALGCPVPEDPDAPGTPAQRAELAALDAALSCAEALREARQPLVVLWHFPPYDRNGQPGPAVTRLEQAGVTVCVYGHLHATDQWARAPQGVLRGVRYAHVAADAIGFRPLRIAVLD